MATTASGVTIPGTSPTTTAATPIQDHWNNLGKSLNGRLIVPVGSVTARAALVSALTAEGYTISTSNPLYTHRVDARVGSELEVTVNGTTWRTVSVLDPAVTASSPSSSGPVGATLTPVLYAPAVLGDGVKKFKITFTYYGIKSTVAGDTFNIYITKPGGVVVGGTISASLVTTVTNGGTVVIFDTPAAGSTVYAAALQRSTGTGNADLYASGVNPMQIIVEQIA